MADEESNLSKVISVDAKHYEKIAEGADPLIKDIMRAIDAAKKFIIRKARILYGGTAIDHALRLKGDKLYDDNAIPDLDFYSPENIKDAYELAEIFYGMGYKEARAIVGIHPTIMKVDIGGNHWICDIAYFTPALYDTLPTLIYQDMRSVHTDYQRIDVHSSLAFPYDNPPREVIFDRWEKDIKRFNIFDKYYPWLPIADLDKHIAPYKSHAGVAPLGFIYSGFIAFAAYCEILKGTPALSVLTTYGIEPGKFAVDGEVKFTGAIAQVDIIHINLEKTIQDLALTDVVLYEQLMNATPHYATGVGQGDAKYVIESSKDRLLSIQTLIFGHYKVKCVSVQYLLRYFIARYYAGLMRDDSDAQIYFRHYAALLALVKKSSAAQLGLSVETYGNFNLNAPNKKSLNAIAADIHGTARYKQPQGYTPARGAGQRPSIDLGEYYFYQENGKIIS